MISETRQNDISPPVISPKVQRGARVFWIVTALMLAGLVLLHFFNPTQHSFYPACHFYKITHLHCPGCGSLRALHLLTHGDVAAAFDSNPLLIGGAPILGSIALWRRRNTSPGEHTVYIRPVEAWVILGVVLVFGVLRNLPFESTAWMSP
jgi:hypothetical protein